MDDAIIETAGGEPRPEQVGPGGVLANAVAGRERVAEDEHGARGQGRYGHGEQDDGADQGAGAGPQMGERRKAEHAVGNPGGGNVVE